MYVLRNFRGTVWISSGTAFCLSTLKSAILKEKTKGADLWSR